MKRTFTLFLLLIMGISMSIAQEETQKPTVLSPTYFDISPPLRDMVQRSDVVVDNSWKEGVVKNKLNRYALPDEDVNISFNGVDQARQSTFGDAMTDTTMQNFDGVAANGSYPPDTDGDVGPNHYMQVVNCRFAVYDKNGNKLMGPSNSSTIFNGLPHNNNDGDAILLYDENADRWLFSQFSLPNYPNGPFYENVAISQTNDPTGTWYRYQFTFNDMPDYPKLSVWSDGYYMTIRRFSSGAGNWIGPAAVAMDRDKMLAGDASASMVMFPLPSSSEGPLSADCDSDFPPAGTPCPVCYLTTSTVKVYDFHVDWATPANSTFAQTTSVPIAMFGTLSGNAITQKGTTQKLDAFSRKGIMFRMPFRKFNNHWSMLLNTTVNVSGVAGIRWMELRNVNNTWSLYQEGTYAPGDGHHRWMGSIAMDTTGNIALGFSISSTNMYPSIRYTGRMSCDPPGEMTFAEKGIINGGGSQTNSDGRWGDYSAMSTDPSSPRKFWYTQEYFSSTSNSNWKTRIGSFSLFSSVTSSSPNLICAGDSTELSVIPNCGIGSYTYLWSSSPAGFTSTLQSPKVAPTETTKYFVTISEGTITHTDSTSVTVTNVPVVSPSPDTSVCWYVTEIDLTGSASAYSKIAWSTLGTGTFNDTTTLETTYFPSQDDKDNGSVDLELTAYPIAPCSNPVSDIRHVIFDACTKVINHSSGESTMIIQPNPARGSVLIIVNGTSGTNADITIKTLEGKLMHSRQIKMTDNPTHISIDLSAYSKSVYILQIKTGQKIITQKLIVQ